MAQPDVVVVVGPGAEEGGAEEECCARECGEGEEQALTHEGIMALVWGG
ncbi:hypothetical protein [Streptomyces nodosus]|nr:hypothetical protein [Streptomyces nodosus]MBB4793839.1 hypothetical protein [Streptomyces nodosus]